MAGEQGLVARHDVATHPAHVLDAEHHRFVERELDEVFARHHGLDAGQRRRLLDIDRLDAGVWMRAAQDFADQHAGR